MPADITNLNELIESRRKGIEETIQPISVEQMRTLGEGLLPSVDHPWRDLYFNFLKENEESDFYHATTPDRYHVLYCHTKNRGIWFLPGIGLGPLQERGLQVLKEVVENQH